MCCHTPSLQHARLSGEGEAPVPTRTAHPRAAAGPGLAHHDHRRVRRRSQHRRCPFPPVAARVVCATVTAHLLLHRGARHRYFDAAGAIEVHAHRTHCRRHRAGHRTLRVPPLLVPSALHADQRRDGCCLACGYRPAPRLPPHLLTDRGTGRHVRLGRILGRHLRGG